MIVKVLIKSDLIVPSLNTYIFKADNLNTEDNFFHNWNVPFPKKNFSFGSLQQLLFSQIRELSFVEELHVANSPIFRPILPAIGLRRWSRKVTSLFESRSPMNALSYCLHGFDFEEEKYQPISFEEYR